MRTGERRHAIEHVHADRYSGRLGADLARPKAIARERLENIKASASERL
jgi:hypothetical protein